MRGSSLRKGECMCRTSSTGANWACSLSHRCRSWHLQSLASTRPFCLLLPSSLCTLSVVQEPRAWACTAGQNTHMHTHIHTAMTQLLSVNWSSPMSVAARCGDLCTEQTVVQSEPLTSEGTLKSLLLDKLLTRIWQKKRGCNCSKKRCKGEESSCWNNPDLW